MLLGWQSGAAQEGLGGAWGCRSRWPREGRQVGSAGEVCWVVSCVVVGLDRSVLGLDLGLGLDRGSGHWLGQG